MRLTITGAKFFQGKIDGNMIDSGKIYSLCHLDDSRNNAKGQFTEEWRVTSDLVKSIIHNPFPFDADVESERIGNGKEAREVITALRPISQSKPTASPKPA